MFRARKQEPEPERKYSCLLVPISGRPAELMDKLGKMIPDRELAAEGRETEPHVTCRWGLHFHTPSMKLRTALRDFGPITVTLGKTSLFTGGKDGDVLKIDVASPDLHKMYAMIGRILPVHTTFPVYHPHATIAYLKPGMGKKYAGNTSLSGTKITFSSAVFSGKDGYKENLPLGMPASAFRSR